MNIDKLFSNKELLEKELKFFKDRKHVKIIEENEELVGAHIKKARHNMKFFRKNNDDGEFNDWLIVILYYSLYHAALALITEKKYTSKNHYATILLLIKEYSITREEARLMQKLSISREDAELYTNLKEDRHDASYSSDTRFESETIKDYEHKVIDFLNKTEEIIINS
mgnify:CR=1 FL=1